MLSLSPSISSTLNVAFSPTAGAPLTLPDLSTCTFFHSSSRPSLFSPASSPSPARSLRLPFLSQADHPATGRPAWYVHPCETQGVVGEVLGASSSAGQEARDAAEEDEEAMRWLETWLMVVSSVVDLRE